MPAYIDSGNALIFTVIKQQITARIFEQYILNLSNNIYCFEGGFIFFEKSISFPRMWDSALLLPLLLSSCLLPLPRPAAAMGNLPDASQEGLVKEVEKIFCQSNGCSITTLNLVFPLQFSGYASMAVFHYTVPPEVARATWEFASFQVING